MTKGDPHDPRIDPPPATKTTTTERYEVCSLCGGCGKVAVYNSGYNTTSVVGATHVCHGCNGSGHRLVERTVVVETLADALLKGRVP